MAVHGLNSHYLLLILLVASKHWKWLFSTKKRPKMAFNGKNYHAFYMDLLVPWLRSILVVDVDFFLRNKKLRDELLPSNSYKWPLFYKNGKNYLAKKWLTNFFCWFSPLFTHGQHKKTPLRNLRDTFFSHAPWFRIRVGFL